MIGLTVSCGRANGNVGLKSKKITPSGGFIANHAEKELSKLKSQLISLDLLSIIWLEKFRTIL